ncbi:hypothetical protein L596_026499 [Steinernema carpocapsae]|uniref:Uncharacterized protein n=1 Tax=Steinernema carpocapsae TaxID=34508 RepID=A0A4V6XVP6_STECR|nr:hypothetical protein L596_026499 [Steinernema carpocapsae]
MGLIGGVWLEIFSLETIIAAEYANKVNTIEKIKDLFQRKDTSGGKAKGGLHAGIGLLSSHRTLIAVKETPTAIPGVQAQAKYL